MIWTVPVSSKGQITLPASIRQSLRIQAGEDKVVVRQKGEKIVLEPVIGDVLDLYGALRGLERKPVSFAKLRKKVRKAQAERIVREGLPK